MSRESALRFAGDFLARVFHRPVLRGEVGVVVLGVLLLELAPAALAQQGSTPVAVQPSDEEVKQAVKILRHYLATADGKRPRRAEESIDTRAAGGEFTTLADLAVPLVAQTISSAILAEGAPKLGTASISISDQLHLGDSSAVFRDGLVFLWADDSNLAFGPEALASANGTATGNTAIGHGALIATVPGGFVNYGSSNTAVGHFAMSKNTTGHHNTALGTSALGNSEYGFANTAVGNEALLSSHGDRNTAVGSGALLLSTSNDNTAVGASALGSVNYFAGANNIALGFRAGYNLGGGSDNILIGNRGYGGHNGTIRIGTDGIHTAGTFIQGIDNNAVEGSTVVVTADGQLGVSSSSRRFKQEIGEVGDVGGRLRRLRAVTFRYRPELVPGGGRPTIGLIAEEVAEILPGLVTRDQQGRPFGVRYDLLSVLLLAEQQKQHVATTRITTQNRQLQQRLDAIERLLEGSTCEEAKDVERE